MAGNGKLTSLLEVLVRLGSPARALAANEGVDRHAGNEQEKDEPNGSVDSVTTSDEGKKDVFVVLDDYDSNERDSEHCVRR